MRADVLAAFTMVFYGVGHALIKHYFAQVNPFISLTLVYLPVIILSLMIIVCCNYFSIPINRPESWMQIYIMLGVGLLFFSAEFGLFSSYQKGATVAMVTGLTALVPVVANGVELWNRWALPNKYTLITWILAGTLLFVSALSQSENDYISSQSH